MVDAHDEHLGLVFLKQDYANFSRNLSERLRTEYKRVLIDELNNLYVASTRARLELYIYIPPRSGNEFNIASLLVPADKLTCGSKGLYPAKNEKSTAATISLGISQYHDWIGYLKEEFEGLTSIRDRQGVLRGNILHYALSRIGNCAGCDMRMAVVTALDKAGFRFMHIPDRAGIERALYRLIGLPQARDFFVVPDGDVYTEREMVDTSGNTLRVDRLIIKEKEVLIVDYKSRPAPGSGYEDQVRSYAAVLRSIYPGRRIRGFLVYLDDARVQEVICSA